MHSMKNESEEKKQQNNCLITYVRYKKKTKKTNKMK